MRAIDIDETATLRAAVFVRQYAPMAEQNERLRNRIAIERSCRAMYEKPSPKQNTAPSKETPAYPYLRLIK